MICLEVFRNGDRLCLAGVPSGSVMAGVSCHGITDCASQTYIGLRVQGVTEDEDSLLDWVATSLDVGDEIVLRVREAQEADPPPREKPDLASDSQKGADEPFAGPDKRREKRLNLPVNFKLLLIGPEGQTIFEERTFAENVSRGGARLVTSKKIDPGTEVHLEEVGGSFRTRAAVRGAYIGKDNTRRLNLSFETAAPDYLTDLGED